MEIIYFDLKDWIFDGSILFLYVLICIGLKIELEYNIIEYNFVKVKDSVMFKVFFDINMIMKYRIKRIFIICDGVWFLLELLCVFIFLWRL